MTDSARTADAAHLKGWECLFLANGFTAVPEPSGGTTHFIEVARHWRESGAAVTVMTTRLGRRNCLLEGYYGPFRSLPTAWARSLGVAGLYLVSMLVAPFRLPWRGRALLCYGTSDLLTDVAPAFLAKALMPRSRAWVNCVFHLVPGPGRRAGSRSRNALAYLAQRAGLLLMKAKADLVIADNPLLAADLARLGFSPDRLFVTAMGVEPVRVPAGARGRYDACFVGRLHESKGVFDLVEAWRAVSDALHGGTLAIVGTGPEEIRERLLAAIGEAGLREQVQLLGYLSRGELEGVLRSSRVFVLPSYEEGFGISLLEAMAHGLPAVAYDLPHYRGIFSDVLQTVPPGDVAGLGDALARLLSDDAARKNLSEKGLALAECYSWKTVSMREAEAVAPFLEAKKGIPR